MLFCWLTWLTCCLSALLSAGHELSGPFKVLAWTEWKVSRRQTHSTSAGLICPGLSTPAALHSGDPCQKLFLQDQTQTGLYPNCMRCQVSDTLHLWLMTLWLLFDSFLRDLFLCFNEWMNLFYFIYLCIYLYLLLLLIFFFYIFIILNV